MQSDEQLMTAVSRGDLAAFERLVLRHQESAWKLAYRLLGQAEEAEDVAQDAFLRLLQAAGRYQPTASFRTFLFRIVTHLCRDRQRRQRPISTEDPDAALGPGASPDAQAADAERTRAIQEAIAGLPPQQGHAIVLRYYERLSHREIADILGASPKGVERLLARGRAALAVDLEKLRK